MMGEIHLWLGVASGLVLFIVCLTGTILTFRLEIRHFLNDGWHVEVPANKEFLSINKVAWQVQKAEKKGVKSIYVPAEDDKPYEYELRPEKGQRFGKVLRINPYDGTVLSEGNPKIDDFFRTMTQLHRWLLLQDVRYGEKKDIILGRHIVGWSTVIFIIISLTGLILWWPKRWKQLKHGLKVKWNGSAYRLNYDLHNTLGFYTLPLCLLMAFTGLFWSFGWYRDAVEPIMGAKFGQAPFRPAKIERDKSKRLLSPEAAMEKAGLVIDHEHGTYISYPRTRSGAISVTQQAEGYEWMPYAENVYEIHSETGEILNQQLFKDFTFGEKIANQIKPLHLGSFAGSFSKWIYFITCLIATSFPITGIIIWLKKLKIKRNKKQKLKKKKTLQDA